MAGAAAVPDLQEDFAALGVDGVGDQLPAVDLRLVVYARPCQKALLPSMAMVASAMMRPAEARWA